MPTPDQNFRAAFVELERTGHLKWVLDYITHRSDLSERELRKLLRTQLIETPEQKAKLHSLQGRLSAYADMHRTMRTLGDRELLPLDRTPVEEEGAWDVASSSG